MPMLKETEYKGYYVTEKGEVFSTLPSGKLRKLKPWANKRGRLQIYACVNGVRHSPLVNRLVAKAFIPNPDNLPCVNHISEDYTDNSVSNLEWCTYAYNDNFGTRNKRISEKMVGNQNGIRKDK